MDHSDYERARLAADIERRMQHDIELAPLTTLGVGGPADHFLQARGRRDVVAGIEWAEARGVPWFVLGLGANIVFADAGYRGLVIRNGAAAARFDGEQLTVDSGTTIGSLIEVCAARGMSGFEHYTGIPSTVGGAMWQNLHFLAPDRERTVFIEEIVERAAIYHPASGERTVGVEWFEFGYDQSRLQSCDEVVLEVTFRLERRPVDEIREVMWANAGWRAERHPPLATRCSVGSIFRKIDGIGAGRLIDEAGLKGHRIGGMQVSPVHANFIVNVGDGTGADLRELVRLVKRVVHERSGHRLETEVTLVGDW